MNNNDNHNDDHNESVDTIWDYPHNTPLSIDEINEVTAEIRFSYPVFYSSEWIISIIDCCLNG